MLDSYGSYAHGDAVLVREAIIGDMCKTIIDNYIADKSNFYQPQPTGLEKDPKRFEKYEASSSEWTIEGGNLSLGLYNYVKNNIYNGKDPYFESDTDNFSGLTYYLYKYNFQDTKICNAVNLGLESEFTSTASGQNARDFGYKEGDQTWPYKVVKLVDTDNLAKTYSFALKSDTATSKTAIPLLYGLPKQNCDQLANNISLQADAIAEDILNTGDATAYEGILGVGDILNNETTTTNDSDPTCGSVVTGIGWIICPIITGISTLNDGMWGFVSSLLMVNPVSQSGGIYEAWAAIRNIANIVFVIIFLIMIFSQVSSFGVSNYGIKKILPRLIIGVILVNISFFIVQISIDLANVLGSGLYGFINSLVSTEYLSTTNWSALPGLILTAAGGAGAGVAAITIAGGAAAAFWMLLPAIVVGALSLLAAVVTLIFRQAVVPILAIIAPLAFVAYLLPNTESWFKKWRDMLMSMLVLYPLAALVFSGSKLAAELIIGQGGWWNTLMGLIVMTLPLFSLPFLASKSGALVSKVGDTLKGFAEKARKPLSEMSKSHEDVARAKYLAKDNRDGLGGIPHKLYKSAYLGRKTRESDTKSYGTQFGSQWAATQKGQDALQRAGLADTRAATDKEEAATRLHQSTAGQTAIEENKRATTLHDKEKEDATDRFMRSTDTRNVTAINDLRNAKKRVTEATTAAENREDASGRGQLIDQSIAAGKLTSSNIADATQDRFLTSDIGKRLQTESIGLKKANTLSTTKIDTEFAQTPEGRELNKNLGIADMAASTEKNLTAEQVQKEAPAEMRMNALAAEQAVTAAKAVNTTNAANAKVGTQQEAAERLEKLGIDATTADQLAENFQKAQNTIDIQTGATNSANNMQKQQFNAELSTNPDLAKKVAGIDEEFGAAKAQAIGTSSVSRYRDENSVAAGTLLAAQRYTKEEYSNTIATGKLRDGVTDASLEQKLAAARWIAQTGEHDTVVATYDALVDMPDDQVPDPSNPGQLMSVPTEEKFLLQQELGKHLTSSSKKEKSFTGGVLGELSVGKANKKFGRNSYNFIAKGKVKPQLFQDTDSKEITSFRDAIKDHKLRKSDTANLAVLAANEAKGKNAWDPALHDEYESFTLFETNLPAFYKSVNDALGDKRLRDGLDNERIIPMEAILTDEGLPLPKPRKLTF